MKRILGHVGVIGVTTLVLGLVSASCVDNDQSIFVRGALAPATNRQNNACVYTDDPQQPLLFEGLFDVGVADSYSARLIVGSQMLQRGDPNTTRAEPNRVHLNGAVVRVTDPSGAQIAEFTSFGTGFADIQQNNNPDFGVIGVVGVDFPTKEALKAQLPPFQPGNLQNRYTTKQVILNIKVFGKTLGGIDLESGEFQMPLRICNGCLVTRTLDPALPNDECPSTTASAAGGTSAQLPCIVGQEESVPCQLCRGKDVCDRQ